MQTVLASEKFWATLTGRANFAGNYPIGPSIVDVTVTQTVRADGTICFPNYGVSIDGEYRYGGPARFLSGDLAAAITQSGQFASVVRMWDRNSF